MFAILLIYKTAKDESHFKYEGQDSHIHHEIQERERYDEYNSVENLVRRIWQVI